MSRNKKQKSKQLAVSSRRRSKPIVDTKPGWFSRHPVLLFLLTFGVLMGLFYAFVIFTPFYKRDFLLSYLPFNAKLSGAILSFLGQDITVAGASISSPAFSVTVDPGCDGIEPIALFACAVLAFPAPFLRKVPGVIAGTLVLAILNFVRVVSLFLIGVYFPKTFYFMHLDVWQAMFILFAVIFWIIWLQWATQSQRAAKRIRS